MQGGSVIHSCSTTATTVGSKIQRMNANAMDDDNISKLSDEVLVSILSFIPIKEAGRTSVLSRRWDKVWTFIPNLNFDASEELLLLGETNPIRGLMREKSIRKACHKYVGWVNSVLRLHQAPMVNEFKVQFDLDQKYSGNIDTWVEHAFERKVKCLSMDFEEVCGGFAQPNAYGFPVSSNTDYQFLQKLILRHVFIEGYIVQCFLRHCPHLEELTIVQSDSRTIAALDIDGRSTCLKHLKVVNWHGLMSIRLSATNLSSFKVCIQHWWYRPDISYDNVPSLVKASIQDICIKSFDRNFPQHSNFLLGLKTLKLYVTDVGLQVDIEHLEFPEMPYLENLTFKLRLHNPVSQSLLPFVPLIQAAPILRRVKIVSHALGGKLERKLKKYPLKCQFQCLKEIEVASFTGYAIETEFIRCLIENATVLGKIVIDCKPKPTPYNLLAAEKHPHMPFNRKLAMKSVKHLNAKYSLGEKLVVLNL